VVTDDAVVVVERQHTRRRRGAARPTLRTGLGEVRERDHRSHPDHLTHRRRPLHQLIREAGSIRDRTFEVVFEAPGAEVYCFTFG